MLKKTRTGKITVALYIFIYTFTNVICNWHQRIRDEDREFKTLGLSKVLSKFFLGVYILNVWAGRKEVAYRGK